MDWFLYDRDFRRERVNYYFLENHQKIDAHTYPVLGLFL